MGLVAAMAVDMCRDQDLGLAHAVRIGALDAGHGPAPYGHPLHVAPLRVIVVDRIVLGRAVVPHGDGVRRPVMAELIFGDQRLVEQRIEQRAALAFVHILDGDGELRIDEKRFAARHRVDAHDRMHLRRIQQLEMLEVLAALFGAVEQGPKRLEIVNGFETRNELLHAIAEAVERRRHAHEHGVAADRRHLLGAQDRRHRRLGAESLVRVPDIGTEGRVGLVVPELDELGCRLLVGRERMHGQFAEAPAEIHQIVRRIS